MRMGVESILKELKNINPKKFFLFLPEWNGCNLILKAFDNNQEKVFSLALRKPNPTPTFVKL